jgi:hypothetical protein
MKKFFLASVFASVSAPVLLLAGFSIATAPALWLRPPRVLTRSPCKDPAEFNATKRDNANHSPRPRLRQARRF